MRVPSTRAQDGTLTAEQVASLDAMARVSLTRWGHPYPLDIAWEPVPLDPTTVAVAAIGCVPQCWIGLNVDPAAPAYLWHLSPELQQRAIDHEIGHLLGLYHPIDDTRPQVMRGLDSGLTMVDRERYRALWPTVRPYQVIVGPWAHD